MRSVIEFVISIIVAYWLGMFLGSILPLWALIALMVVLALFL